MPDDELRFYAAPIMRDTSKKRLQLPLAVAVVVVAGILGAEACGGKVVVSSGSGGAGGHGGAGGAGGQGGQVPPDTGVA